MPVFNHIGKGNEMPAYMVYICQKVIDRGELEIYWSKIGPTLEGYQARSVAAYTPFEQLEGDKVDGVAVVEFPSAELAKAWYNSAAYVAIRHHRLKGAKYIGLLAEGGALPPELRMPHTKA
jgi:uncharacterized protein (DUF1330 family)